MKMTEQKTEKKNAFFQKVRTNIITGLFITIPVIITVWVAYYVISVLTDWAVKVVETYFASMISSQFWESMVRLVTIIIMLVIVFFVGLLAKVALGQRFIKFFQNILLRVPLLRVVYSTCEQIGETIKSSRGGLFKKVVMFEYPRKGCYSIGFITNFNEEKNALSDKLNKDVYSVFMPTTPNPTSGFLMLIPKEECFLLDMSISEAMTLIVSCGTSFPQKLSEKDIEKADQDKTGGSNAD